MTAGQIIAGLAQHAPTVATPSGGESPKELLAEIKKSADWIKVRNPLTEIGGASRPYIALALAYSSRFREFAGPAIRRQFDTVIQEALDKISTITRPTEASRLKSSLITMSQTARGSE